MSSTSPPQVVPRRSRRRWFVAAMVLLVVLTPAGFYFVAGWLRNRELEAIYRELDATDPNWRWPDLLANRAEAPPDEQNSALQVLKVHGLLASTPLARGVIAQGIKASPNTRLSDQQAKTLREKLASAGPNALIEARKLRDMPKGRFPFDPDGDPRGSTAIARTLVVMRVLHADAFLRGHGGEVEGAAESCQALLHVVNAIDVDPTLMDQLVHQLGQILALGAIERTLAQGTVSRNRLTDLRAALAREADCEIVLHAVRGERAFRHQLIELAQQGKIPPKDAFIPPPPPGVKGLKYRLFPSLLLSDYAEDLRFANELVQAAKLYGEARNAALLALEAKWRTRRSDFLFILGATMEAAKEQMVSQSRIRSAITALAAERYRLEHGNWPIAAGDLVKAGLLKEPLLDPYDGKPLRWKRTPTGLIIYSVGPDQTDNGGNLSRTPTTAPGFDLGFELWNPSSRGLPAR